MSQIATDPTYDILDVLEDHGIDTSAVDASIASALSEIVELMGVEALAAFVALVGPTPTKADVAESSINAFFARYEGTFATREQAAMKLVSVPGGLLDGVGDLEAAMVYFDTEKFLEDMAGSATSPLLILGDGPVHILWRKAPQSALPF